MKIFDCFTYFNEIDLLKLRIEISYEFVDYFYYNTSKSHT